MASRSKSRTAEWAVSFAVEAAPRTRNSAIRN